MTMKTQPYKNLWNAAKAVHGGKFIAMRTFLKVTRKILNNLICHLKELEKELVKPKVSRRKEKIKIK